MLKLNSLNHPTERKLALRSAATGKTLAMSGPTASNPLHVCGAVVATCTGDALKRLFYYFLFIYNLLYKIRVLSKYNKRY
jgi:hypothetical protein